MAREPRPAEGAASTPPRPADAAGAGGGNSSRLGARFSRTRAKILPNSGETRGPIGRRAARFHRTSETDTLTPDTWFLVFGTIGLIPLLPKQRTLDRSLVVENVNCAPAIISRGYFSLQDVSLTLLQLRPFIVRPRLPEQQARPLPPGEAGHSWRKSDDVAQQVCPSKGRLFLRAK
jgi:hypothetical protein